MEEARQIKAQGGPTDGQKVVELYIYMTRSSGALKLKKNIIFFFSFRAPLLLVHLCIICYRQANTA